MICFHPIITAIATAVIHEIPKMAHIIIRRFAAYGQTHEHSSTKMHQSMHQIPVYNIYKHQIPWTYSYDTGIIFWMRVYAPSAKNALKPGEALIEISPYGQKNMHIRTNLGGIYSFFSILHK